MIKKKLCLVIPTLQAGGMERVMSELAGYFCQKNELEVHMVFYGRNYEVFYPLPESLIVHHPVSPFNNKLRFIASIGRLLYLRREFRKISPDSILSFGEFWNSFVLLSLIGLTYPVYISDRCSPEKKYSLSHSLLRKFLYPRSGGIISQTEKAREIYFKAFKHKNITVIGNPIRQVNTGNISDKQNNILMVGRLIKSKNQDRLIELFLNIKVPGWKLVLVGYDHLKQNNLERLKAIISQNKAEQKVLLEGKQSDVDYYYSTSRIFAFTSTSEGFPNAIGEAMSAGVPVVAFDCVAGPSEMIRDNHNGFLIPAHDYKMFQDKLEILMNDEPLREKFGKNASVDIKKFSIESIGEKFLEFILKKK